MAKLVIIGPDGPQERDLATVNSLGRHPNNSIQLLDRIVSKEHCVVELRGSRWVLRDLGSLNGIYVNEQRVAGESFLSHGDQIALGNTRAVFQDVAAPPPAIVPSQGAPMVANPVSRSVPPIGAPPRAPPMVAQPLQAVRNVTIGGAQMESHVRTKIAAQMQQFLPERSLQDVEVLRRDYEKLRVSFELTPPVPVEVR